MLKQLLFLLGVCLWANVLAAQCFPDRHSTNWFDGWVSCTSSPNPNPAHAQGHWILYDFGEVYAFGQMKIWNVNDPAHLGRGLRDVVIEVSHDGIVWESTGQHTFDRGPGHSTYEGDEGPDLQGIAGRYLLITAESNWGGSCFGLSEIRIEATKTEISDIHDVIPSATCFSIIASPNPFDTETHIQIHSVCGGQFDYLLIDALGRILQSGTLYRGEGTFTLGVRSDGLAQGTYILQVRHPQASAQITLVKLVGH